MSTAALSRTSSKALPGPSRAMELGSLIWNRLRRRVQVGKDRRYLQMLPDRVLADMGLEKIEIMSGTGGSQHVWVVPHRYR